MILLLFRESTINYKIGNFVVYRDSRPAAMKSLETKKKRPETDRFIFERETRFKLAALSVEG
jgi:hypothetical protein